MSFTKRLQACVTNGGGDYVTVFTLAAGRSCNDIHVSLKCALGDGGGVYMCCGVKRKNLAIHGRWRHLTPPKLLLLTNKTKPTLTITLTLTDTVTVIFLRAFR